MRRNIKRSLPPLDVISFSDSSSAPSKRRMQLTTPNVGEEIEKLENENNEESAEIPSLASVSFELPFPNESESDVDDSDGEKERQTDNSYMRKQRQSAKHWSEIRNDMVRAVIESECIPDNQLCTRCTENTAVYRCLKCGAGVFYCEPCVTAVYTTTFVSFMWLKSGRETSTVYNNVMSVYQQNINNKLTMILSKFSQFDVTVADALTLLTPEQVMERGIHVENPGWLSDKILNSYFWILQQTFDDLVVIPSSLPSSCDDHKRMSHCKKLLIPLFVNGQHWKHWTLLAFNKSQEKVIFMDPERKMNRTSFPELDEFISNLLWRIDAKTGWSSRSWTYCEPDDFPLQQDNYNCGAIVCLVALSLAKGESIEEMNAKSFTEFRKEIAIQLGVADYLKIP